MTSARLVRSDMQKGLPPLPEIPQAVSESTNMSTLSLGFPLGRIIMLGIYALPDMVACSLSQTLSEQNPDFDIAVVPPREHAAYSHTIASLLASPTN